MNKYIYIIVGVVWIISQVAKAKKKTKEKEKIKKRKPQHTPSYETIDTTKTIMVETESKSSESQSQEILINETEGDSEIIYSTPQQHLSASSNTYINKNENPLEIPEDTESSLENIDARKAIMYSEIFGKPKWKDGN